ncbi:MAG TPA: TIGR03668 family PPOX class F420-dependent oxidoreductase [Acidimicrobiales bacterium]|nr:TIGR03668 family PPOX class F420-dependent oxidoreductase [Acidimicrobiales bacterium]
MDEATMRRRVQEARVGHLATVRADGRPHVVPCCFTLGRRGGVVYSAVDAKPKSTLALRRLDNLRVNPSASLLVDHYGEDWSALWWVRIDGIARIIGSGAEFDRAVVELTGKYEQYARQPPPGPVVAIDIDAWSGWPS